MQLGEHDVIFLVSKLPLLIFLIVNTLYFVYIFNSNVS